MDGTRAEELVERYADAILRIGYTWLGDMDDAKDICQTVLIKLVEEGRRFPDLGQERAWVVRLSVNACKNWKKSAWFRRRAPLEEGLHHEEEHAEVEYIVAHGISSRLHGKKVLVGSYHFLFEDERIPLTEEQRQTIRNHARGKSNIFLAIGRRAIGMIGVSDPPRPEAAETIARLKRQGISSIIMLTGDSESAARAISRQLGITEYRSQVLPEDKARFIQQLKKSGKTVCMVGDGINDSPALSCADVSVSMKDSSDIAREVADISLLSSSLAELVVLRELSCAVLEKIERNYRFIVGFNSSLILLGMFGLITPAFSAFLHNASTVYVSARSTRRCLPLVRGSK